MEKRELLYAIICFIIGCIIGGVIAYSLHIQNNKYDNIVVPDTTYNKVVLDSIELRIIKKDSIIYNIKNKMKDEVTKVFELDDSSAVKLFKQLCAEP